MSRSLRAVPANGKLPPSPLTATDVKAMLTRHYLPENRPPAGILGFEVGSPDGKRNADALWVPMTLAGGRTIVGHEIKVSRADVAAELADLTKADAWARYCDQWWLTVSDPKLVEGLDIPEHWGIMAPPSGRRTRSMTVIREAPKLKPIDQAPAFHRFLCWREHRTAEHLSRLEHTANHREKEANRLRRQLEQERLSGGTGVVDRNIELAIEVIRLVRAEHHGWDRGVEESRLIADAILDRRRVEIATDDLRRHAQGLLRTLRNEIEPAQYMAERIDKALKENHG